MTTKKRAAPRCGEVVQLLTTHQALSSGTIRVLLNPPVSRRRTLDILATLTKDGTIFKRSFRMFGGHSVFYELSTPLRAQLNLPRVYSANLVHSDFCAVAHEILRRRFPSARFSREHAIGRDPELRRVMAYQFDAPDSLPDILMSVPTADASRPIHIAVEIERMAKSELRLLRKFSKYAMRTHLDAVIYLSEDPGLLKLLRRFYQSRIIKDARRIAHYPNNFMLTGACPTRRHFELTNLQNSEGKLVLLAEWIQKLAETPPLLRRDSAFAQCSPVVVAEKAPALTR